ncbi:pentapeptide repeat-containing protein [Actinomadura nitritigenes]|uniref:pentapeptide repeat-containing protein n=1 Tax=Actinomadura nitritigenes TaxID=134602 RepID=UPI003D8FF338
MLRVGGQQAEQHRQAAEALHTADHEHRAGLLAGRRQAGQRQRAGEAHRVERPAAERHPVHLERAAGHDRAEPAHQQDPAEAHHEGDPRHQPARPHRLPGPHRPAGLLRLGEVAEQEPAGAVDEGQRGRQQQPRRLHPRQRGGGREPGDHHAGQQQRRGPDAGLHRPPPGEREDLPERGAAQRGERILLARQPHPGQQDRGQRPRAHRGEQQLHRGVRARAERAAEHRERRHQVAGVVDGQPPELHPRGEDPPPGLLQQPQRHREREQRDAERPGEVHDGRDGRAHGRAGDHGAADRQQQRAAHPRLEPVEHREGVADPAGLHRGDHDDDREEQRVRAVAGRAERAGGQRLHDEAAARGDELHGDGAARGRQQPAGLPRQPLAPAPRGGCRGRRGRRVGHGGQVDRGLDRAHLDRARLDRARFERARFERARFDRARFDRALRGAHAPSRSPPGHLSRS